MVRDGHVTSSAIHRAGYTVPDPEALDLIHAKETSYRELFAPAKPNLLF